MHGDDVNQLEGAAHWTGVLDVLFWGMATAWAAFAVYHAVMWYSN